MTPALLAVLIVVSGCASRIDGVLIPISESVPGASKVDLLVATTRKPSDNPALLYSGERDQSINLTEIVVSIPPDKNRKIGEVQWPKKMPPNPLKEFATVEVKAINTETGAKKWLDHSLPKSRRVMVFVHGFNNTFEDSVYRFAQIVHDSGAEVAPVIFTWPSRGSVFDYNYDKESTNYSRDAL